MLKNLIVIDIDEEIEQVKAVASKVKNPKPSENQLKVTIPSK